MTGTKKASSCVPAEGTQCVNIPLLSPRGRRTHLGRALGRRMSMARLFRGTDQRTVSALGAYGEQPEVL